MVLRAVLVNHHPDHSAAPGNTVKMLERKLREELEFHLTREAEERRASGRRAEDARSAADRRRTHWARSPGA